MGLNDFDGNICDQIESNESPFGEFKYKDNKLQNANIEIVGNITGLNEKKGLFVADTPISDGIKNEFIPSYT